MNIGKFVKFAGCRVEQGVDQANRSTSLLVADQATGFTYLGAFASCTNYSPLRHSRPVTQRQKTG